MHAVYMPDIFPTPTASMMTLQDQEQARYSGNGGKRPAYGEVFPTPTARNYGTNQGGAAGRVGKVRPSLETMARRNMWPTPTKKSEAQLATDPSPGQTGGATLRGAVLEAEGLWVPRAERFPTPTKSDGDGGQGSGRRTQGGPNLRTDQGGLLNPEWVESHLMAWPRGWTDLRRLAMGSFQEWLLWHGRLWRAALGS